MAIEAGCDMILPLLHDLFPSMYPSAESLQLTASELQSILAMNPKLAACVMGQFR